VAGSVVDVALRGGEAWATAGSGGDVATTAASEASNACREAFVVIAG
jgi:hypothetical protein